MHSFLDFCLSPSWLFPFISTFTSLKLRELPPCSSCLLETTLLHLLTSQLSTQFQPSPLLSLTDRCSPAISALNRQQMGRCKWKANFHKTSKEIPPFLPNFNPIYQIVSMELKFLPRGKPPNLLLFLIPFSDFHPHCSFYLLLKQAVLSDCAG